MNTDKPKWFWGWVAGFTDSDGCIYNKGNYSSLRFTQKDRKVLDYITNTLGCGIAPYSIITRYNTLNYHMYFNTYDTKEILKKILPHLWIKKYKAVETLGYSETDDSEESFLSWLAGFIDGDGCIGIYKDINSYEVAKLTIAQKNRDVLDYIVGRLKSGSVCKRGKTSVGNTMHYISFGSAQTREVLERILPYLYIKKEKAIEVLARENKVYINATTLNKKYNEIVVEYKKGKSAKILSEEFNIKVATILYWLRSNGLSRTLVESQKLRREREYINGGGLLEVVG